jgi:phosphatidylinositol phospholipase C delta
MDSTSSMNASRASHLSLNASRTSHFDYQKIAQEKSNHVEQSQSQSQSPATTKKKDWTKVKGPATSLQEHMKKASGIDPVLYAGIAVWKLTTNGKWKRRILTLSQDNIALFCTHARIKSGPGDVAARVASTLPIPLWTPSRGFKFTSSTSYRDRYVRYIDVADIDSWQVGVVGTQRLELMGTATCPVSTPNPEKLYFSIYHHGYMTFDLLIANPDHRRVLEVALTSMTKTYQSIQQLIGNDALLLRYIWYDVDQDISGGVSSSEFLNICHRINLTHKAKKVFRKFREDNNIDSLEITYAQCMQLLQSVRAEKVENKKAGLWKIWFGDTASVSAEVVWDRLLQKVQKETTTTIEDAEALLKYLQNMDLDGIDDGDYDDQIPMLHKSQFEEFLISEINDAYDPVAQKSAGRLDMPISYYWINTSHNTYLTGDQLQSRSSVEAYVRALNRGCKCLELDCWDGESKTSTIPVVFHGHTITSKIKFRSICEVVQCYIETHPNTYPIILSLENHCSHNFQRVMASDMRQIFGSRLFVPTVKQTTEQLPSPEALRGMVVIKGKRPPEPDDSPEDPASPVNASADTSNGLEEEEDDDPYDMTMKRTKSTKSFRAAKSMIVPELAQLTLFHGTKFKNFKDSIKMTPSHMHSIGESKITKLVNKSAENPALWREYNIDHMTRTYPAGLRVESSNYNPVLAWAMGSQLVALNFQTHDTNLLLNDGLFRQGGGCGYVLKPDSVMGGPPSGSLRIKISVISGHCIPKPKGEKESEEIDPYVKVELHDVRCTSAGKEEYYSDSHATKAIDNNGYCPVWNEKGHEFDVQNPDVAIFSFNVVDTDIGFDDQIAGSAIPVSCLRCGYRSVQLHDMNNSRTGAFSYATLLVKIEFVF